MKSHLNMNGSKMKGMFLTAVMALSLQPAAHAEAVEKSRVLRDSTTVVVLELNDKSVFCTDRGYGNIQLKVSVPDLDWLAHFDHRVVGESKPCITGGICSDDFTPGKIIDPQELTAVVPLRIILTEKLRIDEEKKTCERMLEETVKGHIRGHDFHHFKSSQWESASFEVCSKVGDF